MHKPPKPIKHLKNEAHDSHDPSTKPCPLHWCFTGDSHGKLSYSQAHLQAYQILHRWPGQCLKTSESDIESVTSGGFPPKGPAKSTNNHILLSNTKPPKQVQEYPHQQRTPHKHHRKREKRHESLNLGNAKRGPAGNLVGKVSLRVVGTRNCFEGNIVRNPVGNLHGNQEPHPNPYGPVQNLVGNHTQSLVETWRLGNFG